MDNDPSKHSSAALEVTALCKSYAGREVVSGVSFSAGRGEIVGLLGPNGAGKTTTVSMICGLTTADSGEVRVCGERLATNGRAKRRIGLVPQELALFDELPARQNLTTFGALYGLDGSALTDACDAALELVGLADRALDLPRTFSGGMKRRLNLACALLHDPDILLLDEPTVGIDPQSRNAIFENLEALQARGKTIVYTTHYMEEVERLCDRIVIIDHGKVVANDRREGLQRLLPESDRLIITLSRDNPIELSELRHSPGVSHAEQDGAVLTIAVHSLSTDAAGVLALLNAQRAEIRDLHSNRASLETLFLNLTGRQLRDETT